MDEMEQPDDEAQIELLQQGEGGAGQLQTKRITTPYMTKYTYIIVGILHLTACNCKFVCLNLGMKELEC